MRKDEFGLLVSEILPSTDTGNYEDSCANTCRKLLMECELEEEYIVNWFDSDGVYQRHPRTNLPPSDMSWDQAIPLFMVYYKYNMTHQLRAFMMRLRSNGYRLNGNAYPNLMFVSLYKRVLGSRRGFWDIPLVLQAIIMKWVPWRWDDSRMRFSSSAGSTADYVNYFHYLCLANATGDNWATKLCWLITPKEFVLEQIKKYYRDNERPEPNIDWMLELYEKEVKLLV